MSHFTADLKKINNFCEKNAIEMMILFGSFATGESHPKSDVDIAILPKNFDHPCDTLSLIGQLCDIFERDKIDLVIINSLTDPTLLIEIFSKGQALYQAVPELFQKQYLRAWKLYIDTEKIRKAKEEYVEQYRKRISHVA